MSIFSHFPNLYHDKSVQKSTYFPILMNEQFTFPLSNSRTDITRYHIFRGIRLSPLKGSHPRNIYCFIFVKINIKDNEVRTSSGHTHSYCANTGRESSGQSSFFFTPLSLSFILKLVKNKKIYYPIGRDVKT